MNQNQDDIDITLDNILNLYTSQETQKKAVFDEFRHLTLERFSNLLLEELNPEDENTKKLVLTIDSFTNIDEDAVKVLSEKMSETIPPQTLINLYLVSKFSSLLDTIEIISEKANDEEKKVIKNILQSNKRISQILQI